MNKKVCDDLISEFVSISKIIGDDPLLVQGAGGNTSIKIDSFLKVKASGTLLANATKENIFVDIQINEVRENVEAGKEYPASDYDNINGLRPSIETALHALMPHKVVFHVHCINTLSWAVSSGYHEEIAERLSDIDWVSVPYRKPGLALAKEIRGILQKNTPSVLILENHGLIVAGDMVSEVKLLLEKVSENLARTTRPIYEYDLSGLKEMSDGTQYKLASNKQVHQLAMTNASIQIVSSGTLYPDHVVFLGPSVLVAKNKKEIFAISKRQQDLKIKQIILVPNMGVLVHQDISKTAEAMILALYNVVSRIPDNAAVNYLSREQENELLNWDAEKYRQSLDETYK